jgi:hypothetical protein
MVEIKRLIAKLRMGRGEFIRLAREVSHNGALVCLGQLTRRDVEELVHRLREIEIRADLVRSERSLVA